MNSKITKRYIIEIIKEIINEDFLLVNPLLNVSEIVFTNKVQTLSISLEDHPKISINSNFLKKWATDEDDVKACLIHELFHVVFGHTIFKEIDYSVSDLTLNIVHDAIINANIHLLYGDKYSKFFSKYYEQSKYPIALLRQIKEADIIHFRPPGMFGGLAIRKIKEVNYEKWKLIMFNRLHEKLYTNKVSTNDIIELIADENLQNYKEIVTFIGTHETIESESYYESGKNRDKIKKLETVFNNISDKLKEMSKEERGIYKQENNVTMKLSKADKKLKEIIYYSVKNFLNKSNKKNDSLPKQITTNKPFVSQNDRKGFLLRNYTDFLYLYRHNESGVNYTNSLMHVYLDVSGSFIDKVNIIANVLRLLRGDVFINMWCFSNEIFKVDLGKVNFDFKSTYGTSINPVMEHFYNSNVDKCVIITDGYVEEIAEDWYYKLRNRKILVLISENGNSSPFRNKLFKTSRILV